MGLGAIKYTCLQHPSPPAELLYSCQSSHRSPFGPANSSDKVEEGKNGEHIKLAKQHLHVVPQLNKKTLPDSRPQEAKSQMLEICENRKKKKDRKADGATQNLMTSLISLTLYSP